MAAVDYAVGAIEIIDSRYSRVQFQPRSAVADNSSRRVITGPVMRRPDELDLGLEACLLEVDSGRSSTAPPVLPVLGHPGEALAFAANTFRRASGNPASRVGWCSPAG